MNWKESMTFALLFVTASMYTSLCRMYMKLQEPSTLTGLEVETCSVSLGELMMCVRKAVARLRLHSRGDVALSDQKFMVSFCQSEGGEMNGADSTHSTSSLYVLCIRMSPFRFNIYRAAQAHAMMLLP